MSVRSSKKSDRKTDKGPAWGLKGQLACRDNGKGGRCRSGSTAGGEDLPAEKQGSKIRVSIAGEGLARKIHNVRACVYELGSEAAGFRSVRADQTAFSFSEFCPLVAVNTAAMLPCATATTTGQR